MLHCSNRLFRFAMPLALVVASSNVSAVPVSWVADDGLWQTPANWSSNPSLPGAVDDVTIDRPGSITVTLSSGNPTVRSILSQENLIIGGGSALTLTVGAGGGQINGPLTVSPGAHLVSNGGVLQSNGSVIADSANLRVQTSGQFNLPNLTSLSGGTGFSTTRLIAETGGTLNLSALPSITTGAVEAFATGPGSTIDFSSLTTFSPDNANGTRRLWAENGGRIISPNLTTIVGGAIVQLSGATSMIDLADLTTADNLNLRTENGGTLTLPSSITSYSGSQFSTDLTANGMNSRVNLPGVTSLSGGTGFATVRLVASAGGTVNLSAVTSITTGAVEAFATGPGSTIDFSSLTTFSPDNANGTRRLRAENGGTIRINSAGTTTVMGATVELNPTGSITGDTLELSTGATLSGNGLIDANYSQVEGGTLRINIGGLAPDTQFDQIRIDGNADLGGTLEVAFTNNFVPEFGQAFEILQITGTRSGEFDEVELPSLTGGLQWDLDFNPNSIMLQVVNFYGDYNGNGVVDAADYVVWRNTLNAMGINQPADGDRNRVVNQLDYDFWSAKFGQTSGSGAGIAGHSAVPEPASLVFGAQLLLILLVRIVGVRQGVGSSRVDCSKGANERVPARAWSRCAC
jgi:hypothetical protein